MLSGETPSNEHSRDDSAAGMRIGVVTSTYHGEICSALRTGALDAFARAGGAGGDLLELRSPGAYELVALSLALAERTQVDAVVALCCVLTGETSHDRYICDAVAHGLVRVTLETGKPVAFGLLTCATIEQARARAGGKHGNKGAEAMQAAIAAVTAIRDGVETASSSWDNP